MSEHKKSDSEVPAGFSSMETGEMHSTVANFVGGYERIDGLKIAIWYGVEREDGEVVLDTGKDQYEVGYHDHIVEVLDSNGIVESKLVAGRDDAWQTANRLMALY